MTRCVSAPMDKMKELILNEYPRYYSSSEETKTAIILEFIKEHDAIAMYEYMKETERECEK